MIVVDVGCDPHGGPEDSIGRLAKRFDPEVIFAFDPLVESKVYTVGTTAVIQKGLAAWVDDGGVPFKVEGLRSGVDASAPTRVPSFDLAAFLRVLPGLVILKVNIEGGEYPLLTRLKELELDQKLKVAIVQWHEPDESHGFHSERPDLCCPVEDWWLW